MENHPTIEFRSSAVEVVDDTTYRVTGDLTIKGTTRPVTFDLEYTGTAVDPSATPAPLEGSVVVNRKTGASPGTRRSRPVACS